MVAKENLSIRDVLYAIKTRKDKGGSCSRDLKDIMEMNRRFNELQGLYETAYAKVIEIEKKMAIWNENMPSQNIQQDNKEVVG